MRITASSWRYLPPLLLLPAALFALVLRQADAQAGRAQAALCQPAVDSADGAELLLQLVGAQELQRQAQHEINALLE